MSSTAEGMRGYKPRRPETTLDDVITPEIRAKRAAMIEEVKDEAKQKAAGNAYDKTMPSPYKKGGSVDKSQDKSQDKAMIKKAFKQHDAQEHKGGKGTSLKLAKGGKARRFAEGGMTDAEQEAADKAAGLAASNKEPSAGFFARLRAGNIDEPGSEAYEKYGAGRGKALRMSSAPVAPSASAKMEKGAEPVSLPTMGEDERPAPTGMGAATVLASSKAAPAKTAMPVRKAELAPAPVKAEAKTAAKSNETPKAPAIQKPVTTAVDELDEYAKNKKANKEFDKAYPISSEEKARLKKMENEQALENIPVEMLAGQAGATALGARALMKYLAKRGKTVTPNPITRATMRGSDTPAIGNSPARSTAPYLKEIGNSQPRLGMKKGGMAKGGSTNQSSASRRGDGIATKGKTRGRMC